MNLRTRSKRIELGQYTTVSFEGRQIAVKVLNVSYGGVLFSANEKPALGNKILLGENLENAPVGTIVRHSPDGFAVELEQNEEAARYALQSIVKTMAEQTED
jgi:PilZ domain